jgi:ubiquinone/menaquinone biosynthesis C-methylase UbiE
MAVIPRKIQVGVATKLMRLRSRIGTSAGAWEGYFEAREAKDAAARERALLSVSEARYRESYEFPLDKYFGCEIKPFIQGKNILEIGSNLGGAALAYCEQYSPSAFTGIDVTDESARISNMFFEKKNASPGYRFMSAYAENLPFEDGEFDCIITFDTLEHVRDIELVMGECARVLKEGGTMLLAFPSFWHPTQHHLGCVTDVPFIHWFFNGDVLMEAYYDILDRFPEYRDRIGLRRSPLQKWERLLGINGTTRREFCRILDRGPWREKRQVFVPLGGAGMISHRARIWRYMSYAIRPFTRLPGVGEVLCHRIVFILTRRMLDHRFH